MKLLAYVDGSGAYEKTKPAGIGVVLVDRDSGELIWSKGFEIGFKTNNEAEYSAVIQAMYQAVAEGCDDLVVRSDSRLIVNQINGDWRIHENHLKDYYEAVMEEKSQFACFVIEWVSRTENRLADKLASGACHAESN